LEIAGYSVAIDSSDKSLSSYLERELVAFKGGHGEDVMLRIELVRDSVLPEKIPGNAKITSPTRGLQVMLQHEIANGELLLKARACKSSDYQIDDDAMLHPLLLSTLFFFLLQHLKATGHAHICLIHACAAIKDGQAIAFAGKSGVGKSTAARLLMKDGSFELLGDDMVPVSRSESGWVVHASPLGGDIPRPMLSNTSAPLRAIYFLAQEEESGWHGLGSTQALASLISSVVPAQEIKYSERQTIGEYDHESLSALMQDASMLASDVPCFSLSYLLDEQPWERIFQDNRDKDGE
jgi:hypothetical protein